MPSRVANFSGSTSTRPSGSPIDVRGRFHVNHVAGVGQTLSGCGRKASGMGRWDDGIFDTPNELHRKTRLLEPVAELCVLFPILETGASDCGK